MVNWNFENNNLKSFQMECEKRDLVVIGNQDEINAMRWSFLIPMGIESQHYYYISDRCTAEKAVKELETKRENKSTVILIASRHPYLMQRLLIEAGFTHYYCSQLFMERYCFLNNTNVCYFYLDD